MANPYPHTANEDLPASDLNASILAAASGTLSGAAWASGVSGGAIIGATLSGATLTGTTTLPGSGQITSGGNLGIGGAPSVPLHEQVASSTVYSAANLATGARAYIHNTNTTNDSFSRLGFVTTDSAAAEIVAAGVTAIFTNHTAGAVTADTVFQNRNAGTIAETARISAAGLLTVTGAVNANSGTAIPAGGTAGAGLKVSSATNFGVFFGSGAPTLSAAKGSLYLRSDGTTTNNRLYVNSDGGTTWVAVTTAS